MLAKRLVQSSPAHNSLLRTVTTSASLQRSPSLADITPNNSSTFDEKQRRFRDQVRAAAKAKRDHDSQSALVSPSFRTGAASTAHPPSDVNSSSASLFPSPTGQGALGSLSTRSTGSARESSSSSSSQPQPAKVGGKLSSLIYGTHEGREMDKEIEKSFSQVLARGKYVHSIVFHTVKPDRVDEYVDLVGGWYPRMAGIEGNQDAVMTLSLPRPDEGRIADPRKTLPVHIWEYQRYQGYHASLHSIASHPEFRNFDHKLKSLITSKTTSLMQEFSFWPTTPPRQLGGLFELRSYTLRPGNLLEWETHWRKGLKARKEVMEGVGAWFVQIGDLNTVHHLWQFADLEERKTRREMSWGVEGWGETVHKTVPLIQTMKSRILIPMPWSPVA
ncbi:MAG: hypothetical protein Q9163_005257 [Psora crenata]